MLKDNNTFIVFHLTPDVQSLRKNIALAKLLKDSFSICAAKTTEDIIGISRLGEKISFFPTPFSHFIGGEVPFELIENAKCGLPRHLSSLIVVTDSDSVGFAARRETIPVVTFDSKLGSMPNTKLAETPQDAATIIRHMANETI